MRPVAHMLGQRTRVLMHYLRARDALLAALLERLDEVQHEQLRAPEGCDNDGRGIGAIVCDSWRRHLAPENIAHTAGPRDREACGGGTPGDRVPAFVAARAEFVAGALVARGLDLGETRVNATFLNSAYSDLQADFLTTGDRERVEAALDKLCVLADSWTPAPADRRRARAPR
jgi:hypothetical protein